MVFRLRWAFILALSAISAPGMTITLNANPSLSGNAAALAAFTRAANTWQGMFSDPIIVEIDAGLAALGPSILGSTSPTLLAGGYTGVRNAMVADAANEGSNGIVAFLPTAAQFSVYVPTGFTLNGQVVLTQANAKALGFSVPVGPDGTITFSSTFGFDFDNSDGVGAGLIDFETVALHEIGHLLGFISWVDDIDGAAPSATYLTTLDLFRFRTADTPADGTQFTFNPRTLVPGNAAVFSDTVNAWGFSTGVTQGDGRQASHWKDDQLTGTLIGVMDPTLPYGFIELASSADARAFDLIGYELVGVPEPGTFVLMGVGLASLAYWRKRRA